MISYVIATKDRPVELRATLDALGALGPHEAEVIVIDNASNPAAVVPRALMSGVPTRLVRSEANLGAAARNLGAREAGGDWLVMLDDDSCPTSLAHVGLLRRAAGDVAAVMADITLPSGRREAGGLPEVFVGCGVAIRRMAFLRAGGYDASFSYYAEEYDLAAKFLLAGWRMVFDAGFEVLHRKAPSSRRKGVIIERLVRNNGWVMQRYAPERERRAQLGLTTRRYRAIANRESALGGYARGLLELRRTLGEQPRREMDVATWDRFTGLAACRGALQDLWSAAPFRRAALAGRGKNDWVVEQTLRELGCEVVASGDDAEVLVAGTLSPGPMLDVVERGWADRRVAPSWVPRGVDGEAFAFRSDGMKAERR
jgi:N-acetylglucosaminyl-diphospho-decaprenol L-rhamnosyltransferase